MLPPMSDGEWISVGKAAEIAGIDRRTVWVHFQRPDAPRHQHTVGGHLRIHLPSYIEWLGSFQKKERRA